MAPPTTNQKWLQEVYKKIEDLPEECYANPTACIEISSAVSLKRIADTLDRMSNQLALLVRITPRS